MPGRAEGGMHPQTRRFAGQRGVQRGTPDSLQGGAIHAVRGTDSLPDAPGKPASKQKKGPCGPFHVAKSRPAQAESFAMTSSETSKLV
ncbi:hypothetical protein GGR23_000305 [Gellertiella hungarica]|uniref:Uncharacterized protein n=1 Tax=Gellertiella hungarica TaxID=1572859 RepID=A0A7W6NJ60_9HYPH|nr:hypothetical protein [Gellertiella hungarica]